MRGWRWAAATLVLITGCDLDTDGYASDSGGAYETGLEPISTTLQGSSMMGTQVGSEGFWTCPVLATRDLGDGTERIDALGASPVELASARLGAWPLQTTDLDDGEVATGTLELLEEALYLWVDVEEVGDCVDHLAVAVRGELQRGDATKLSMTGVLALRPDDGRMILTGNGPLADVESTWGATTLDPALTAFRLDVGLDASALAGTASYVDCTAVTCSGSVPLATVTGTR